MRTKFLFFVLAAVLLFAFSTFSEAQVYAGDSLALVDLYKSTNGPHWTKHTNWLTAKPVSTWYGVSLDDSNRVNRLALPNNALTGTLPSSICHLTKLNYTLDLSENQISGSIPDSIGNLTILIILRLGGNPLTGSLPASVGNMSSLSYLEIYNTKISGVIPASINNLSNLFEILLSGNLLSGQIPDISNLQVLGYVYLANNRLTGHLPFLKKISPNLTVFDVSNNQLTQVTNPDLHKKFPYLQLIIPDNRFTFNGLEYVSDYIPRATYTPQAPLVVTEENHVLSVSAGGTLQNNTYEWVKIGNGSVINHGDSTFQPTASGRYYVKVTNSIATKLTLVSDTVSYTLASAKNELLSPKFSIYPNPVNNVLFVNGLDAKDSYKLRVTDLSGTIWLSKTANRQPAATCNVSNLKSGNYRLTITNGNKVISLPFVKE